MKKVIFNSILILAAISLLGCGDPTKPPSDGQLRVQPNGGHAVGNAGSVAVTMYIFWEVYSFDADNNPLNGIEIQVDNVNAVGQASDQSGNLSDFGTGALVQFLDDGNNPVTSPFKFKTDGRGYYRLGALVYVPAGITTSVSSDTGFSAGAYEMFVSIPLNWETSSATSSSRDDLTSYGVEVDPADYGVEPVEE